MKRAIYKPLYVDLRGFNVVIFGGGSVGTRRARYFLEAGARVKVVAREFKNELYALSPPIELLRKTLISDESIEELVGEADIVVIATDNNELNNRIFNIASRMKKLINNATDHTKGNVIIPFTGEALDGRLKFAVTSLGSSGIAARVARDLIKNILDHNNEISVLYDSLAVIKKALKKCLPDAKRRVKLYFTIESDTSYQNAVRQGSVGDAVMAAINVIAQVHDPTTAECVSSTIRELIERHSAGEGI